MYLRTPTVAQTSTKLSGSGGETRIFPTQRSVDAHSHNGEGTMVVFFRPLNTANISVIHNHNQINVSVPDLQYHKSLMLS
jgi:hypothetical protein